MRSIFLLNGPPGCGKDTVGKLLYAHHQTELFAFARRLKVLTHQFYGVQVPWDHYEKSKHIPTSDFLGQTPRQAYIDMSENKVKPIFGNDVWARRVHVDILRENAKCAALTDLGFDSEVEYFLAEEGEENVVVVRIHRNGHDFSKDSRSYVYHPKATIIDVENNGSIADLRKHVDQVARTFLSR